MSETLVIEKIRGQGVVPILRNESANDAIATGNACRSAGMEVIELTCSTPAVERAIEKLAGPDFLVGLGTVVNAEQAERAAEAGAAFIVSFAAPTAAMVSARQRGLVAIPGAFTPSEVLACTDEGTGVVKLFPAHIVGPAYLRDLKAVMPNLGVLATGGVSLGDGSITAWLEAGALAVGLGSDLGTVAERGTEQVISNAALALAEARNAGR